MKTKKILNIFLFTFFISLLWTGLCKFGNSLEASTSIPNCADEEVKNIVLSITNDELFRQYLLDYLMKREILNKIVDESKDSDVFKDLSKAYPDGIVAAMGYGAMPAMGSGSISVKDFLKISEVSKYAYELKVHILNIIKSNDIHLKGTVTSNIEKDIKKIYCETNVVFVNDTSLPIKYTVQPSEDDGQLQVKVYGLK